jgi:hypothetical protein
MNIHVSWRAASSGHRREIAATLSPDTIGEGTMDRSGEWHSLARVPRHFSRRNVTVSPPRRGQRPWRLRGWLVGRSGYEGADGPAGSAIPGLKRSDCRHHRVMPCLSWQASHVMNPRGVLAASWIRDSKRRHAVTARVSKRNCNLQFSSAIRQETLVISERPTTAGEGERKRGGGGGRGDDDCLAERKSASSAYRLLLLGRKERLTDPDFRLRFRLRVETRSGRSGPIGPASDVDLHPCGRGTGAEGLQAAIPRCVLASSPRSLGF